MPLKDIRSYSAQWTEQPSPDVALPPPIAPRAFLTGAVTLPVFVVAGFIGDPDGPELTGAVTLPMMVAAGTAVVAVALSGAVNLPMMVVAGEVEETVAFVIAASAHIDASGEDTTPMLTPPAGKTTGDFTPGRIQDDENPADAVDIDEDGYTELEWCIVMTEHAEEGVDYEFRVEDE